MTLDRGIYKAIEDVIGPENISDDPSFVYTYALRHGLDTGHTPNAFVQRSAAIVLPKDTFEVQAIVKLCNKYKVPFKATSTGWGFFGDPGGPGVIKMDLRRMNRIIEINEKSMYAVVEPFVLSSQLQAELMKRGLNCNIIGAGSCCSANPFTAHAGIGHMGESTSMGERNILGTEWVTPEGEIVRMGSLGSLGEWLCGDGPGPSLRGIVRGPVPPCGGLGIFTRVATKVYHWAGPAEFPIEGVSPNYAPSEMPTNFQYRFYTFPSIDKMVEAQTKLGESEIAFEIMGFNVFMVAANIATSSPEMEELYEKLKKQSLEGPGFQVILIGNSIGEFEYSKKVLQQIIDETDGKSLEALEDPKYAGGMTWRCIRICGSSRECHRAKGGGAGSTAGTRPVVEEVRYLAKLSEIKKDMIKNGYVWDDGGHFLSWPIEHGHLGHAEMLYHLTGVNPETIAAVKEFGSKQHEIAINTRYGVSQIAMGDDRHNIYGPHACNYHLWLRKIKKTFDPNGLSESSEYITAEGTSG